jgi:pimeloyl-ACP methyl ester carboxylesterase
VITAWPSASTDLTLRCIVGAGHFVQLEAPDQMNAMTERFLALLQD